MALPDSPSLLAGRITMNRVRVGVIAICLSAVCMEFAIVGVCAEDESLQAPSAEDRFVGFPVLRLLLYFF